MMTNLKAFRARDKFADAEWEKRGLNPSDASLSARMSSLLNACTDKLMHQVEAGGTEQQLRQTLEDGLDSFNSLDYDTEEKEFIADYFYGLSQLVGVNIKPELNSWLYGSFLTTAMQLTEALKNPETIIDTLSQPCTQCQVRLQTFVLEKQAGVPSAAFAIARCPACGELNLLEVGNGVKELRFDNFRVLEQLPKKTTTAAQAATRLADLKSAGK